MLQEPSMHSVFPARRTEAGVTLIELLVVVAIVAILAGIAYPSYQKSVAKTRRKAAEACLSSYAGFMERYYTSNLSYVDSGGNAPTLPTLDCATSSNTGDHYTYSFSGAVTAAAYRLRAVPKTRQSASDSQCGTLTLDQTGARSASGSAGVAGCW
jgi:type IV pilus assembly protein PilE